MPTREELAREYISERLREGVTIEDLQDRERFPDNAPETCDFCGDDVTAKVVKGNLSAVVWLCLGCIREHA